MKRFKKRKLIYKVFCVGHGRYSSPWAEIYDDGSVKAIMTFGESWYQTRKFRKEEEEMWRMDLQDELRGNHILYKNDRYPDAFHTLAALFDEAILSEKWSEHVKSRYNIYYVAEYYGEGEPWKPWTDDEFEFQTTRP